jgi:hypothetical protein
MPPEPKDRYDDANISRQTELRLRLVAAVYPQARQSHSMLYRTTWVARDLAEIGALAGRDDLVRRGLRLSGRAAAGLFACAGSREGTARFPMDGDDVFELPTIGPGFSSGPADWIEGFYAALAVRDDVTLDRLCRTPAAALTNGPGVTTSPYTGTWQQCLRAVWRRSPEAGTLLADSLQQTDPTQVTPGLEGWALSIDVPAMELLYRIIESDQAGFTTALGEALNRHREYWSQKDSGGIIALPITALAALAAATGLAVTPQPPYVPRCLLNPARPGTVRQSGSRSREEDADGSGGQCLT